MGRFAGSWQYIATYAITGSLVHFALYSTSILYHGGFRKMKFALTLTEYSVLLFIHYNYLNVMCIMVALFTLNTTRSDMMYVIGQYIMNLPFLRYYRNHDMIIFYSVVLGFVVSRTLDGASRLETGGVEAPRGTDPKEGVPEPPTPGEGHPRERSRRTYYVSTEDRASGGTGFTEAARPFLGGAAQGLQGPGKGHGRSRSW